MRRVLGVLKFERVNKHPLYHHPWTLNDFKHVNVSKYYFFYLQETPSSLAEAEKLLSQHQQIREEIDSYENDYTDMMAYGEKVIFFVFLMAATSLRSL